jgi:hypothetical protein
MLGEFKPLNAKDLLSSGGQPSAFSYQQTATPSERLLTADG